MKTLIRCAGFFLALTVAASAGAADIHVFCTNGIRAVVEELRPRFEQQTGDRVIIMYEPSSQLRTRIDAGEPFDLAILTTALIDDEIKAGKLAADSRTFLARSGLGVSIRSGAKKPNISTVNGFKSALLNAESITYATQGASAQPFEVLVAKLGLTAQLRPNTTCVRRPPKSATPSRRVSRSSASRPSARSFPSAAWISWDRFREKCRAMSS